MKRRDFLKSAIGLCLGAPVAMAIGQSCQVSPTICGLTNEDVRMIVKETLKDLPKERWTKYTYSYSNMTDEEANRRLRDALAKMSPNPPLSGPKRDILYVDLGGNYTGINRKHEITSKG